jgi:hypothetical protein
VSVESQDGAAVLSTVFDVSYVLYRGLGAYPAHPGGDPGSHQEAPCQEDKVDGAQRVDADGTRDRGSLAVVVAFVTRPARVGNRRSSVGVGSDEPAETEPPESTTNGQACADPG